MMLTDLEVEEFFIKQMTYAESFNLEDKDKRKSRLDIRLRELKHNAEVTRHQKNISLWKQLNNGWVDKGDSIEKWKDISIDVSKQLIKDVVTNLSLADGLEKINEALQYGLELEGVSIDTTQVTSVLDKVLQIKLIDKLVERLDVGEYKDDILSRVISQVFPYKDVVNNKPDTATSKLCALLAEQIQLINDRAREVKK